MEEVLLITQLKGLSASKNDDYDRIYFGNEFCQWLIPSLGELRELSDYCNEYSLEFSLLTPWVTDYGLDRLRALISEYLKCEDSLEVIVNDFGVLKMINDEFSGSVEPVLGRLLSNQRRDPRTLPLKDLGSDELYEHYRHSSFDYQLLIDYLKNYGVKRVEIDNLLQGVSVPADLTGVRFSLYYPYNYITVTRNCAFCYDEGAPNPWPNKAGCAKKCREAVLKMNCDEIEEPLYLKGTAIFIKNEKVDVKEGGLIDRLVYSPDIPV